MNNGIKGKDLVGVAFFLGIAMVWSVNIYESHTHPLPATPPQFNTQDAAEMKCINNNGVPQHDSWGSMTDCKIYITPSPKPKATGTPVPTKGVKNVISR